jgi:uncharacterized membrane protein YebE (DUF533 family)
MAVAPAPEASPNTLASPALVAQAQAEALLLVRAMITAAHVDGQLDPAERQRILDRATAAGLSPAERLALEGELAAPKSPRELFAEVRTRELAEQVYVVSLLAISVDTDAERGYLHSLPFVLGLSPADVAALHQKLGVPAP